MSAGRTCAMCAEPVSDEHQFCPYCGHALASVGRSQSAVAAPAGQEVGPPADAVNRTKSGRPFVLGDLNPRGLRIVGIAVAAAISLVLIADLLNGDPLTGDDVERAVETFYGTNVNCPDNTREVDREYVITCYLGDVTQVEADLFSEGYNVEVRERGSGELYLLNVNSGEVIPIEE